MSRMPKTFAAFAIALIAATGLTGCDTLLDEIDTVAKSAETSTSEAASQDTGEISMGEQDYYTVVDTAHREYLVSAPGLVEYCALDELERAMCAYGELTSSQRAAAQAEGRQDITVDPSGWADNAEVTIPARADIEGSKDYNGWFWNRSHLVADSLGGSPDLENLVTGTRTQNVGTTQVRGQYAGGMAYTELIARDYLDSGAGDACPLYYASTPVYDGAALVPHEVIVDIQSCDQSIDERVIVSNTANGFEIDYTTGAYNPIK